MEVKGVEGRQPAKEFVTVVSVGAKDDVAEEEVPGYVTVLKIGEVCQDEVLVEQVLVYRLPGERLGFGLKFEGGTKASECVKRLFIQSCAPDSPASRVRGSWGALVEGDQVLNIDGQPVKSMTRIDCVRCLKDSNVVINLLVKHKLVKSGEDLPQVISAEKKRTPPPPPPVPPRKVPRRKDMTKMLTDIVDGCTGLKNGVKSEVVKRDRKISDGSLGPPEAEVYTDLLSHESPYCLSESDDTGSTISTVIDRLGSFPTTTTSSFAGSLPSTPTVQKRMNLNMDPNEDYLYTKLVSLQSVEETSSRITIEPTLQPPVYFQDAPLSYADEEVRVLGDECESNNIVKIDVVCDAQPPPPPPRMRHKEKNNNDYSVPNENQTTLPRLVDFVPKSSRNEVQMYETLRTFIEHEQRDQSSGLPLGNWSNGGETFDFNWIPSAPLATIGEDEEECAAHHEDEDNDDELLEEVDEEEEKQQWNNRGEQRCFHGSAINTTTPIVIVDNVDSANEMSVDKEDIVPLCSETSLVTEENVRTTTEHAQEPTQNSPLNKTNAEIMDSPAISTRQPPDGHEFPDYVERIRSASEPKPANRAASSPNVKSMIAKFSSPSQTEEDKGGGSEAPTKTVIIPSSYQCSSNLNLPSMTDASKSDTTTSVGRLHTRSQSLSNISEASSLPATDRWSQMIEQRRRGLSKLRGLVIPEHPDCETREIDLPEIRSAVEQLTPPPTLQKQYQMHQSPTQINQIPTQTHQIPTQIHQRSASSPNVVAPLWHVHDAIKYSPAFKRKTLQISGNRPPTISSPSLDADEDGRLADAPKSLESITSPTRSDCSFEYISSSSPELLKTQQNVAQTISTRSRSSLKKAHEENESDNDSAVSSSQSSYVSRQSPRSSPTHLTDHHQITPVMNNAASSDHLSSRRMLKAQSVEAINRKNILASAKCRSGRDFNGGSPLIQRKFDDAKEVAPVDTKRPQMLSNGFKPSSALVSDTRKFSSPRMQNSKPTSVTDLRKNFEAATTTGPKTSRLPNAFPSKSSKRHSLPALVSQTSVLPQRALTSNEVEEVVQKTMAEWSEMLNKEELKVVALRPDIPGSSVGITLAGGTDYETKDITIHKVRDGSAAHRDGRLQKGDRVLAINGKCMIGITHAQSLAVLKEPVDEIILVAYTGRTPTTPTTPSRSDSSFEASTIETKVANKDISVKSPKAKKVNHIVVKLLKDAASGLGFSMEGGKDSPQGDVPLVIKKMFTGGIAEKCGQLAIGDEVLEINGIDVACMPRIDAWTLIKKIPPGEVVLRVQRP